GQGSENADELIAQPSHSLAHQDQVGIVGDVAAGGAEVDYFAGVGTDFAIGVDVGHDVVTAAALVLGGPREVDVVDVGAQLFDLGAANAWCNAVVGEHAQLVLRLGQCYPEPAPGGKLSLRPPQFRHLSASVAAHQGVVVKLK